MMVNIAGKKKWQWNVMDKDSRFLLGSHITDQRYIEDASKHLSKARKQAGTTPEYLFTDGLQAYNKASKSQLGITKHFRCPTIRSHRENNNAIERYHNTVRERDKVIRSYKNNKTAQVLVDGFNDYYNYIREHQALEGQTPAQKAGIILNLGQNKWMGLLRQSVIG
ncbi:MAG: DDE-type integrase/transposase/recombinase [Candidatus Altiarchaeota archaeon]